MLTAELKVNGKVIGTFEARRIAYGVAGRLPTYSCTAIADAPTGGSVIAHHYVDSHDPDRDDGWQLVHKALSWKSDADLAAALRERDEARAEVEKLRTLLNVTEVESDEYRDALNDYAAKVDRVRSEVLGSLEAQAQGSETAQVQAMSVVRYLRHALDGEAETTDGPRSLRDRFPEAFKGYQTPSWIDEEEDSDEPLTKVFSPWDCPDGPHRGPEGPNEDIGQCAKCWSMSHVMRPEGETFGHHRSDCSLPIRHGGECIGGGTGHPAAPKVRGPRALDGEAQG